MEWKKVTTGLVRCELTRDIVCLVGWHACKRELVRRKNTADPRGLSQILGYKQNQYAWQGHVRGDETNKHFYGNTQLLVRKLTLNHTRQIIKRRIAEYAIALEK